MTVGALVTVSLIIVGVAGGIGYFFNDYLFARVLGPEVKSAIVSPGEVVEINAGGVTPGQKLNLNLCGQGGAGTGCFPLAVGETTSPVRVRIPIGYKKGKAVIQVQEVSGTQTTPRLRFTIPVTVQ